MWHIFAASSSQLWSRWFLLTDTAFLKCDRILAKTSLPEDRALTAGLEISILCCSITLCSWLAPR